MARELQPCGTVAAARRHQRAGEAFLIERSMSGEGVHIFLPMPEARGRKIRDGEVSVEIYSRERYIAVTGDRI